MKITAMFEVADNKDKCLYNDGTISEGNTICSYLVYRDRTHSKKAPVERHIPKCVLFNQWLKAGAYKCDECIAACKSTCENTIASKLAKKLDGCSFQYGFWLTDDIQDVAKENGLVIFTADHDNYNMHGAIEESGTCQLSDRIYVRKYGSICIGDAYAHDAFVDIDFCKNGEPVWECKTNIPHSSFTLTADGNPFVQGIVFSVEDLK